MTRSTGKIRLYIASWVLLGLVVLGYNGSRLMALLDAPIPGHSPEVRQAMGKHREWEALQPREADTSISSDLDRLLARFTRQIEKLLPADKIPAKATGPVPPESADETLPVLSGLLRVGKPDGSVRLTAVLDGKPMSVKDRAGAYTVAQIDFRGVTLEKDGRKWFIPAPDIRFSKDRGF